MSDEYRVVVTSRAASDLHAIYDYIRADSPQNASSVVERILESAERLSKFPHRYPVIIASRRPPRETRLMPVRPFLVYYRVVEEDCVVLVLRVEHGSRDRPARVE